MLFIEPIDGKYSQKAYAQPKIQFLGFTWQKQE